MTSPWFLSLLITDFSLLYGNQSETDTNQLVNAFLEYGVNFDWILHYNPIENVETLHWIQESEGRYYVYVPKNQRVSWKLEVREIQETINYSGGPPDSIYPQMKPCFFGSRAFFRFWRIIRCGWSWFPDCLSIYQCPGFARKGGKYLDTADAVRLALSGNQHNGNGSDCDHLA